MTGQEVIILSLTLITLMGLSYFVGFEMGHKAGDLKGWIRGWKDCRRRVDFANEELKIMGEKSYEAFTDHIDQ